MRISVTLQTPLGSISVGAMLSSNSMDSILQEIALQVNTNTSQSPRFNFSLSILSTNPVRAALDVCEKLVTQRVYAIIVSRPANSHSPPIAVSYTCGFYQIPVVGISTRESVFSDKVSRGFEGNDNVLFYFFVAVKSEALAYYTKMHTTKFVNSCSKQFLRTEQKIILNTRFSFHLGYNSKIFFDHAFKNEENK